MLKSRFVGKSIPKITTAKSSPITTNFAKGVYTYKPNDTMDTDEASLAQDARFDRVGEYGTRRGIKALSNNIIGLYEIGDMTSMLSPAESETEPQHFVIDNDARICGYRIKARKVGESAMLPVVKFTLYINEQLADTTCINPDELTNSAEQIDLLFNSAPDIEDGDSVEIRCSLQTSSPEPSDNYIEISAIGEAPGGSLLACEPGGVDSIFEANIDGEKTVLFTQAGVLYAMDESGNIEDIRSLPDGATTVRYSQNLNQIRYVDGLESPHLLEKIDGNWVDNAIVTEDLITETDLDITPTNIMNGTADNLMYFASEPDTEVVWTYPYGFTYAKSPAYSTTATIDGTVGTTLSIQSSTITPLDPAISVGDWITGQGRSTAEVTSISGTTVNLVIVDTTPQTISSYDKFNVDYYQNLPAIKTGDPLTAMFNLAGVLYFQTRRNKYQMYMQSADSWTQAASNAQGGTFSQESVVCDLNYAYFANDNGVYVFDGSSEQSLTQNTIQNTYDAIEGKESIRLELFKNRLYVFYSSKGNGTNDTCLVYNINLRVWESFDANTYICATSARQNASGRFLCGHSRIGLIMLNEPDDADYSNLGQPLAFNLETSYLHFGTTSQLKRITKWRPEFATSKRSYSIACGYALDFTDEVKYAFSINLLNKNVVNESYVWDDPSDYGAPAIPTVHTTIPRVNGEFYRCQLRYQHIAAFEPVIFRSHTLTVQTQRIR